jgi:hypothetical protein
MLPYMWCATNGTSRPERVQGTDRLVSGSALASGDRSTNDDHFATAAAIDLAQQDVVAPEMGSRHSKG